MNSIPSARPLAHANALRSRGSALPPEGVPAPAILDSWVRCMSAGLDPHARISVPVVEQGDLAQRRHQNAVVRRMARAELETLAQQIAGSNFLLAFADREGVILDLYQDNRFSMSDSSAGIVAGSCWGESLCGTNGLGTALADARPVAVTGMEHFFLQLGAVSCAAAPVHDAAGDIVGVLDASSYFESRQRHTLALVQMAATHLENGLFLHQMRPHWVLAIHPRPEYLGTQSAGLLACSEEGRVLAMNARCTQMLHGLSAMPGAAFDELFGQSFALVAAGLARQGEVRLRDLLGSSLVARCVQRPPTPMRAAVGPAAAAESQGTEARSEARLSTSGPVSPVRVDGAVAAAFALAERASRLGVPILLQGETGTGKEQLARHIHEHSGRSGAFVAVNCGALPAELVEAELFGYAGGAFTGSRREGSPGLIASAQGGTLLLDEVGELPWALQASLLRFLDDQMVRPVGGTRAQKVDVQLLAATHADLDEEVAQRRFRADLLYRLNTVRVALPPLREREDFEQCVRASLEAIQPGACLDADTLPWLARHRWPGNFRELRSVLTRALILGEGRRVRAEHVRTVLPPATGADPDESALQHLAHQAVRREFERQGGSVSKTSRALGISRTTVYRHLKATQPPGATQPASQDRAAAQGPPG